MRRSSLFLAVIALLGAPACSESPGLPTSQAASTAVAFEEDASAPPLDDADAVAPEDPVAAQAASAVTASGSGAAISGAPAPTSTGLTLSSPPWPEGTDKIALSWVVHPAREDAGGIWRRHIDLTLRAGATIRVFPVEVSSTLMVDMTRQPLCLRHGAPPARSKDVTALELMGGGFTTIALRRVTETSLEIAEIYETCGVCEPGPCPADKTVLGHVEIPAGVSFTERILDVEALENDPKKRKFREVPIECDPNP